MIENNEKRVFFSRNSVSVGDVYYISPHETVGSELEPKLGRPAIVLYVGFGTVTVAYLTSKLKTQANGEPYEATYVLTSTKYAGSAVKLSQICTVDESLLGDFGGKVAQTDLIAIQRVIHETLCKSYLVKEVGGNIASSISNNIYEEKYNKLRGKYRDLCYRIRYTVETLNNVIIDNDNSGE